MDVFYQRARLDREIAEGAPLEGSLRRSLRAGQLLRPEERRGIAAALNCIVDAAEDRVASRSRAPDHHSVDAVASARAELLELIALLRGGMPMTARAVALAQSLACDRDSPLRSSSPRRTVGDALAEIAAANA
jgi:hypothetical protein